MRKQPRRSTSIPKRPPISILVLDNYNSFTYNLIHSLEKHTSAPIAVYRNDALPLEAAAYDKILLSPGPGLPDQARGLKPLIQTYAPTKFILGICLGHQAIAEVFRATLHNAQSVWHGVATPTWILDETEPLFTGLPKCFQSGRYHSWTVSPKDFPRHRR